MKSAAGLMAAVSSLALFAAPAVAQTPPADAGIDVIIITANLREENLQDVALSATALPEDTLGTIFSGGEDVLALATRVPGVYAESSNGRVAPRFYIRGLGNTDFDLAASQPVSIIMDDVVMENVVLKSTPLFDLDQVEVYRGPQGTLFGRNTTAGIIRFTSRRPTEEADVRASLTYGSYDSSTFEGAVGGALIPGLLSSRVSVLYQHRGDWIDNTQVPGDNNLGEFTEAAARLQFLLTPSDDLDILLSAHGRSLEGTAAIFRANILGPGNDLNGNYDRDRVSFDQGDDNPQAYDGWGASANIDWKLGSLTLTSITAYESTNGSSRGDIDGGACAPLGSPVPPGLTSGNTDCFFPFTGTNDAVTFPGFIPFASDTKDGLDDLEQVTQEIRIASDPSQRLKWQAGAFFFDSSLTITTVGPLGFPPSTTVKHDNTSWALFGQASYDLTDAFTLTGGLRYTEDEKDFTVPGAPANDRSVSDDHVSWDVSAMYAFTDSISVYGRIADGFRGPSIQGRDVAFFNPPSVAQSETVMSYEAGWKATFGNTLRLNGAVFTYKVNDIQLTAVGGGGNLVQLINADEGQAYGAELDAEWAPLDNLVFTGGFSYTDTELNDSNLAVGICAQCTITDPTTVIGGATRALVDGNPFPNAPEFTADITARYSIPFGVDGEFFAFTDWAYQGDTNLFIYESQQFNTDGQFEGGLKLGYAKTDGSWEAAVFARNITDEDNVKGAIDFNNNTGFVNDPRIIGVSLKINR